MTIEEKTEILKLLNRTEEDFFNLLLPYLQISTILRNTNHNWYYLFNDILYSKIQACPDIDQLAQDLHCDPAYFHKIKKRNDFRDLILSQIQLKKALEISVDLEIPVYDIYYICKEAKVRTKFIKVKSSKVSISKERRPPQVEYIKEIWADYLTGISLAEIGKKYGKPASAISKIIKREKIRAQSEDTAPLT
jgi:hypothetical protein